MQSSKAAINKEKVILRIKKKTCGSSKVSKWEGLGANSFFQVKKSGDSNEEYLWDNDSAIHEVEIGNSPPDKLGPCLILMGFNSIQYHHHWYIYIYIYIYIKLVVL